MENPCVMIDLKSTSDARPWAFSKSIAEYMYHLSAALYVDGCKANGFDVKEFHLLAVENKHPYGVMWYQLDDASIDKGRELYRRALNKIVDGLQPDAPQFYPTDIETISIPAYAWTE
jgi:exodeoxyribonuclease VIII